LIDALTPRLVATMADFEARVRLKNEARKRARAFVFGEPVTNVCAGEGNTLRHAFFVKKKGDYVEVTDKQGKFCNFGVEVMFAGHLPIEEAEKLFRPFHEAQYGPSPEPTGAPNDA
jgi:hypothetical protein